MVCCRAAADSPIDQQRDAFRAPPFDIDTAARHAAVVEVLAVHLWLVGFVDVDLRYLPETADERLPDVVSCRRGRCCCDEVPQRVPRMRITAETPLAMDDVEAVAEHTLTRLRNTRPEPSRRT